jgi:DNA-directed RNA polymerase subunit RPC12/RpoP
MPFHLIYHRFPDQEAISPFDIAINQMAANQHLQLAFPYLTLRYLRGLVEVSQSWLLLTDVQAWINSKRSDARAIQAFIVEYRQCIHDYRGLHAKAIIAGNQALVGSANLTVNALIRNDELLVHIEREPLVGELQGWFDDRWAHTTMVNAEALERSIGELTVASVPSLDQRPLALPSAGPRIRATLLPASRLAVPTLATDGKQRVCLDCGRREGQDDVRFYRRSYNRCKDCHANVLRENRKRRAMRPPQSSYLCARCHEEVPRADFYPSQNYCKRCYNKIQIKARQKPERKRAVSKYNNLWLKQHPEVTKRAQRKSQQRARAAKAAQRPKDKLSFSEAATLLGVTRQRVSQYAKEGRLPSTPDPSDKRRRLVDAADVERLKAEREKRDA